MGRKAPPHTCAFGRIRVPRLAKREVFPGEQGEVLVELRGESLVCRWDPRTGPDRERSGVLAVGGELRRLVRADEVLMVGRRDGRITLR
jgi:hypothetical protein